VISRSRWSHLETRKEKTSSMDMTAKTESFNLAKSIW